MAKKKKPFGTPEPSPKDKKKRKLQSTKEEKTGFFRDRGVRETIESIVVAVMLALMFRAYEAEAFVIPTGSMAPTLEGRHLDTVCDKCGYEYLTGASSENPERKSGFVFETTCPICRYEQPHDRNLDSFFKSNEDSFNGDRILVSKFAYDFSEPKRWDVIVFKFPGNPKQNYIKRLIGLPGETVKIINGDIYVKRGDGSFEIARKPPKKLSVMMQLVDDTRYIAPELQKAKWPSRWQQWTESPDARAWKIDAEAAQFSIEATASQDAWLGYRHLVPRSSEWGQIEKGELPQRAQEQNFQGELITDYYAYNDAQSVSSAGQMRNSFMKTQNLGVNWVGDLAVEAKIKVKSDNGQVGFDLVEAGVHFTCWIDLSTGIATVSSSDKEISFGPAHSATSTATTGMKGAGTYRVRFANADNELTLWINEKVVQFDKPLTYERDSVAVPVWNGNNDPADAQPVNIGARKAALEVSDLRVLRDLYYVQVGKLDDNMRPRFNPRRLAENPELWSDPQQIAAWEDAMRGANLEYPLETDQFMPLGDNSPESSDARMWTTHYVQRDMLTGKALFVYWPHAWRPFWPNFKRMGFIR
jgi:signal peptidase I